MSGETLNLIKRLRTLNVFRDPDATLLAQTCEEAAKALELQLARINELETEKSNAFRAGMEAEAYLLNSPAAEDG